MCMNSFLLDILIVFFITYLILSEPPAIISARVTRKRIQSAEVNDSSSKISPQINESDCNGNKELKEVITPESAEENPTANNEPVPLLHQILWPIHYTSTSGCKLATPSILSTTTQDPLACMLCADDSSNSSVDAEVEAFIPGPGTFSGNLVEVVTANCETPDEKTETRFINEISGLPVNRTPDMPRPEVTRPDANNIGNRENVPKIIQEKAAKVITSSSKAEAKPWYGDHDYWNFPKFMTAVPSPTFANNFVDGVGEFKSEIEEIDNDREAQETSGLTGTSTADDKSTSHETFHTPDGKKAATSLQSPSPVPSYASSSNGFQSCAICMCLIDDLEEEARLWADFARKRNRITEQVEITVPKSIHKDNVFGLNLSKKLIAYSIFQDDPHCAKEAKRCGFKLEDKIVSINGIKVDCLSDLQNAVYELRRNDKEEKKKESSLREEARKNADLNVEGGDIESGESQTEKEKENAKSVVRKICSTRKLNMGPPFKVVVERKRRSDLIGLGIQAKNHAVNSVRKNVGTRRKRVSIDFRDSSPLSIELPPGTAKTNTNITCPSCVSGTVNTPCPSCISTPSSPSGIKIITGCGHGIDSNDGIIPDSTTAPTPKGGAQEVMSSKSAGKRPIWSRDGSPIGTSRSKNNANNEEKVESLYLRRMRRNGAASSSADNGGKGSEEIIEIVEITSTSGQDGISSGNDADSCRMCAIQNAPVGLACGHQNNFHFNCMKEWASKGRYQIDEFVVCPLCDDRIYGLHKPGATQKFKSHKIRYKKRKCYLFFCYRHLRKTLWCCKIMLLFYIYQLIAVIVYLATKNEIVLPLIIFRWFGMMTGNNDNPSGGDAENYANASSAKSPPPSDVSYEHGDRSYGYAGPP